MPVTEDTTPNDNLGGFTNYKQKYSSMKTKLKAILYENELFQDELRTLQRELLDIYRDKETLLERVIQYEDINSSSSDSESLSSENECEIESIRNKPQIVPATNNSKPKAVTITKKRVASRSSNVKAAKRNNNGKNSKVQQLAQQQQQLQQQQQFQAPRALPAPVAQQQPFGGASQLPQQAPTTHQVVDQQTGQFFSSSNDANINQLLMNQLHQSQQGPDFGAQFAGQPQQAPQHFAVKTESESPPSENECEIESTRNKPKIVPATNNSKPKAVTNNKKRVASPSTNVKAAKRKNNNNNSKVQQLAQQQQQQIQQQQLLQQQQQLAAQQQQFQAPRAAPTLVAQQQPFGGGPQLPQQAPTTHQVVDQQTGQFFSSPNDANINQLLINQLHQSQQGPDFGAQFAGQQQQAPQHFAPQAAPTFQAQARQAAPAALSQPANGPVDFNHQLRTHQVAQNAFPAPQQQQQQLATPQGALIPLHQHQQHDAQILANIHAQQLSQLQQQPRQAGVPQLPDVSQQQSSTNHVSSKLNHQDLNHQQQTNNTFSTHHMTTEQLSAEDLEQHLESHVASKQNHQDLNHQQQTNDTFSTHHMTTEQLSAEELEQHLESRRMEQAALLLPDWESSVPSEIFSTDSAIKFMAED